MFWPTVLVIKHACIIARKNTAQTQKISINLVKKYSEVLSRKTLKRGVRSDSLYHVQPGRAGDSTTSTTTHTHMTKGWRPSWNAAPEPMGNRKTREVGQGHHNLSVPSVGTGGGPDRPSWLRLCPCARGHSDWLGHQWGHGSGSLRHSVEEDIF